MSNSTQNDWANLGEWEDWIKATKKYGGTIEEYLKLLEAKHESELADARKEVLLKDRFEERDRLKKISNGEQYIRRKIYHGIDRENWEKYKVWAKLIANMVYGFNGSDKSNPPIKGLDQATQTLADCLSDARKEVKESNINLLTKELRWCQSDVAKGVFGMTIEQKQWFMNGLIQAITMLHRPKTKADWERIEATLREEEGK